MGGQGQTYGVLHHRAVENREHAWHAKANRAGVGVRSRPECGGTTAKDLAVG